MSGHRVNARLATTIVAVCIGLLTLGCTVLVIIDNLSEPMWRWPAAVQEARQTADPHLLQGWTADRPRCRAPRSR